MDGLYNQTLHHLDKAFRRLEGMVPSPQKVPQGDAFVFRHVEKTIQQAMVQKLARVVSGLHAAQHPSFLDTLPTDGLAFYDSDLQKKGLLPKEK